MQRRRGRNRTSQKGGISRQAGREKRERDGERILFARMESRHPSRLTPVSTNQDQLTARQTLLALLAHKVPWMLLLGDACLA